MLQSIAHIMFYTPDKSRLVEFYQDKLGFVLNNPNDQDIFMMHLPSGSPTIGFIQRDHKRTEHPLELTFLCESRKETVEELKEKGVEFTNEQNDVAPGMFVANFDDPDGNHLAVMAFKE